MAIDPATAKLIAKVAINTLTDEEKRQRLIIGIVIAVTIFLCLILLPLFLLLSPIETLKGYFTADSDGNINDISYTSMVNMKEKYDTESAKANVVGELNFDGGTFPLPVNNLRVTCKFGSRIHPVTGKQSFHTGIDLAGVWHSDIMSVEKGQIVFAGVQKAYGNCVEIEHINKDGLAFFTFYAHLARIDVIEGQEVLQGSVIGLQGGDPKRDPNPGYSTGSHLHFEIRKSYKGDYIDPYNYLFGKENI